MDDDSTDKPPLPFESTPSAKSHKSKRGRKPKNPQPQPVAQPANDVPEDQDPFQYGQPEAPEKSTLFPKTRHLHHIAIARIFSRQDGNFQPCWLTEEAPANTSIEDIREIFKGGQYLIEARNEEDEVLKKIIKYIDGPMLGESTELAQQGKSASLGMAMPRDAIITIAGLDPEQQKQWIKEQHKTVLERDTTVWALRTMQEVNNSARAQLQDGQTDILGLFSQFFQNMQTQHVNLVTMLGNTLSAAITRGSSTNGINGLSLNGETTAVLQSSFDQVNRLSRTLNEEREDNDKARRKARNEKEDLQDEIAKLKEEKRKLEEDLAKKKTKIGLDDVVNAGVKVSEAVKNAGGLKSVAEVVQAVWSGEINAADFVNESAAETVVDSTGEVLNK